jgi:hypothetical protein
MIDRYYPRHGAVTEPTDAEHRIAELEAALTMALTWLESWVKSELEGTSHFEPQMAEIQTLRAALSPRSETGEGER